MLLLDLHNCRVRKMIVMIVAYDNSVDYWDIVDLARYVGVPFGTQEGKWRATRSKDRIKQDSKTTRELDIVTSMAKPGGSQCRCRTGRKEGGLPDWNSWRSSIWRLVFPCQSTPYSSQNQTQQYGKGVNSCNLYIPNHSSHYL